MTDDTTRRRLLKSAAAGTAVAAGLTGTASALPAVHDAEDDAVQDGPYTVVAYEKSEFQPMVLSVPEGATVTFLGNRYPHTVTSTSSWTDVVDGCGDGSDPYDGDDDPETYDGESCGTVCTEYTVSSPDESYSVFLNSGGTAHITYETAGRYPYYCVPHCGQLMMGEIVVGGDPS